MEAKKLKSMVRRAKKADSSFGVAGSLVLSIEMDQLDLADLCELELAFKVAQVQCEALNGQIRRRIEALIVRNAEINEVKRLSKTAVVPMSIKRG